MEYKSNNGCMQDMLLFPPCIYWAPEEVHTTTHMLLVFEHLKEIQPMSVRSHLHWLEDHTSTKHLDKPVPNRLGNHEEFEL